MALSAGATAVRQRRFNLDWMKPPKPDDDGSMALIDHLKELRYRVIVSVIAIVVAMIVGFIYGDFLFRMVMRPFNIATAAYEAAHPGAQVITTAEGLGSPILLTMKIALYAGILMSCPIWLYQIWAFIAPGMLAKEKKYAFAFLGSAIPLFVTGVALGYWISPKGFAVLLSFTPDADLTNLQEVNDFLSFELIMLLVFGVSFLLPVILVTLNLLGVLRAQVMSKYRILAIFACFVFGAVATPSADPFSMCALAVPMGVMYLISEVICHIHDKRAGVGVDDEVMAELQAAD